jgi:molybdate/tungstate transport system substrate-binding protein
MSTATCLARIGALRCGRPDRRAGGFLAWALAIVMASGPCMAVAAGAVNVLYAGSLVNVMERGVGPAFERATGDRFRGYAGGSKLLANQIKARLRPADVFVSANPTLNEGLMGQANGNRIAWYVSFAESPLVIGCSPGSRFAAEFKSRPWYQVLEEPGIRIGRTDPNLDPKGALTVKLMKSAQAFYRVPELAQRVLGPDENAAQVFPEEALVGRLQSGQLDCGFFYSTETSAAGIPAVKLPEHITPKAVYTVAVIDDAPDRKSADEFVGFLLGPAGRKVLSEHGLSMQSPKLVGNPAAMPRSIRSFIQ